MKSDAAFGRASSSAWPAIGAAVGSLWSYMEALECHSLLSPFAPWPRVERSTRSVLI